MNFETFSEGDLDTLLVVMNKASRELENYLIDINAGETEWRPFYNYQDIITKIKLQLALIKQRL